MKAKAPLLALLVVVAIICAWWFLRPNVPAAEKTAAASTATKAETPKLAASSTQVALPKAPPVPADPATVPADPSPDPNNPQADLKTAIPYIVNMLRLGDIFTLKTNFTAPNTVTPQQHQERGEQLVRSMTYIASSTDPKFRADMQKLDEAQIKEYESFENQTPTYNSTGNEATYTYKDDPVLDGDDFIHNVTFVKINGKWYMKGMDY